MYQVTIDNGAGNVLIYDNTILNNNLKLSTCTLTKEINKIQNLTFDVPYSHSHFDEFIEFSTKVKVFNTRTNTYDFKGRVLSITTSMDSNGKINKNVVCESQLGYLNDSVQPYTPERQYSGDASQSGLQEFITTVLNNHNYQVNYDVEKAINCGDIEVRTYESSDGVYKGLNYESTWQDISEKIVGVFGGEIRLRETDGALYLDYAESFGTTRSTTIELGRNMKSCTQDFDATKIITRLIPLGSKIKDESGNETEERVTIVDVNDGLNYIEDTTAFNRYGVIYGTAYWDDVTSASNLITKAQQWLVDNNNVSVSNNVTALNLYLLGLDIDDIVLGDSYPVKNSLMGIDDVMRVTKTVTNIISPQNSTFDLGDSIKTMSDILVDLNKSIINVNNAVKVNTTTVTNDINNVYSYIETNVSGITQTESEIQATVERHTETIDGVTQFNSYVSNALSMDADGTTMLFTNIDERIETVGETSQSQYNEIKEYIRFEDGNILLGKSDNPFTLTIKNDQIAFIKNGTVMSYWDMESDDFYVGNIKVDVNERAQFGDFAFVPQKNGSLSFVKYEA